MFTPKDVSKQVKEVELPKLVDTVLPPRQLSVLTKGLKEPMSGTTEAESPVSKLVTEPASPLILKTLETRLKNRRQTSYSNAYNQDAVATLGP